MTGELIQMNAHMVKTSGSVWIMVFGLAIALVFAFVAVIVFIEKGWKMSTVFMIVSIAGIALFVVGIRAPRVKEIKACAYGPVSLEQVAICYDIVDVDGKMLTLRVR